MVCVALRATLFPYTTLFRSESDPEERQRMMDVFRGFPFFFCRMIGCFRRSERHTHPKAKDSACTAFVFAEMLLRCQRFVEDRKSTRLNSSHRCISYAVFCLK